MATLKDEIMARSGPEDNLVAVKTDVNTSAYHTAGPDWAIIRDRRLAPAELHYKDEAEADRFFAQASTTGPAAQILRDVMTQRDVCAKQIYMHQLCEESRKAHQRKQCTPTALDYYKCGTKLARAVDVLCRKPFWDYHACVTANGKGSPACLQQWTAFDRCTEGF